MTGRDNEIFIASTNSSSAIEAVSCACLLHNTGISVSLNMAIDERWAAGSCTSDLRPVASGMERTLTLKPWGTIPCQPLREVP